MNDKHQLVAIVFTDIVGFTKLMEVDEAKTYQLIRDNRLLHQRLIECYQGTFVKEMGDGILAYFPSARKAYHFARDLLEAITNQDNYEIRLGMHLGEVILEDGDIFGDEVNISSRIINEADPNAIAMSRQFRDAIVKKTEDRFQTLGKISLKNVSEPIQIYQYNPNYSESLFWKLRYWLKKTRIRLAPLAAIILTILAIISATIEIKNELMDQGGSQSMVDGGIPAAQLVLVPEALPLTDLPDNSIAVLPFTDNSSSGDQAYLASGIAETILLQLSQIKELQVTAQKSSVFAKTQNLSLQETARYLQSAHILEGSIQKVGSNIRVIAKLVDARAGSVLWSGNAQGNETEIFDIQDDIANKVSEALKVELGARNQADLDYKPDLPAYDLFMRASYELSKHTAAANQRATELFRQAIALDPNYARVYLGLAKAYRNEHFQEAYFTVVGEAKSNPRITSKVQPLVDQALDLEPESSEAHAMKASVLLDTGRAEEALETAQKAVELNPSNAEARVVLGGLLSQFGRNEEFIEQAREAVAVDPQSSRTRLSLAVATYANGQAEKAMQLLKESIKLDPSVPANYGLMARWLQQFHRNRAGEAMLYMMQQYRLDPNNSYYAYERCLMFIQVWQPALANQCMNEMLVKFPNDLNAQLALSFGNADENLRISALLVESEPNSNFRKNIHLDNIVTAGRYQQAIDFVQEAYPVFASSAADKIEVTPFNHWPLKAYSFALIKTGQNERAQAILVKIEDKLTAMRLMQATGFTAGNEMGEIYALQGKSELALTEFERVVNNGYGFYSFASMSPFNPYIGELAQHPRFLALVEQLQSDMDAQYARYLELRDEPLL